MKKVIIIKIEIDVTCEERKLIEDKIRRGYEEGLIILPHFCTGFVQRLTEWRLTNEGNNYNCDYLSHTGCYLLDKCKERRCEMTNKDYIICCLNDEIDDGGASWESCVHYHINCPYTCGDKRAHCFSHSNDFDFINRKNCVACKAEWLEMEVDS